MNEELKTDELIDAALDSYPLAPLPPMFVDQVMSQIKAASPRSFVASFRLELVDVMVPGLMALLFVASWLIGGSLEASSMEEALAHSWLASPWLFLGVLLLVVEVGVGAALCIWLWGD